MTRFILTLSLAICIAAPAAEPPVIWDEARLADWSTPLAALNARPAHFTAEQYYRVPPDNLRTYPVYLPDREPLGYWLRLQTQAPEPLVDATKITDNDGWIAAGERAFREIDFVLARTNDPQIIARARDPESFKNTFVFPDGSVTDPRWVVTNEGVMLTTADCASCHSRLDPDSRSLAIAGPLVPWPAERPAIRPPGLPIMDFFGRMYSRLFLAEDFGTAFWRTTATPWLADERVDALRNMQSAQDLGSLFGGNNGGVPRINGSPFYGAKVPDLHLLRYYKYLDATATHQLRGAEDIGRYIAQLSSADPMEFGPHHMLTAEQRRVAYRFADEVLYAIGMYVMSLEPAKNPVTASPDELAAGSRVFQSEGCAGCHTPPNYTNGKLTLAEGYEIPSDHPNLADVMPVGVKTDNGLAMKTRKGTGFYKVPSLRGVWYRPFLLHDGSVKSLEELFDPQRLEANYSPRGWNPPGVKTRAVPGHEFGLRLSPEDKAALLTFLRSL
jgi:mono/diheme cytochrome c family protein